jgi:hypothetical protein
MILVTKVLFEARRPTAIIRFIRRGIPFGSCLAVFEKPADSHFDALLRLAAMEKFRNACIHYSFIAFQLSIAQFDEIIFAVLIFSPRFQRISVMVASFRAIDKIAISERFDHR